MARTITLDAVSMVELRVTKDEAGQLRIFGRYNVLSGGQIVQTVYKDITSRLGSSRRTAAASLFDGTASDVAGFELV